MSPFLPLLPLLVMAPLRRLLQPHLGRTGVAGALVGRLESCPPASWRRRRRWGPWRGGRTADLSAARLDFAEALFDVRTRAGIEALDRVGTARSLHELWHLREAIFGLVAQRHDQGEAMRRLVALDRYFTQRRR